MNEVWKEVSGYENRYMVSNIGRVKSFGNNAHRYVVMMSLNVSRSGYMAINMYSDSGYKRMYVHRLVANAFICNPDNKRTVNHKNGDKGDNRVENLEWMSHADNVKHSFDNGFRDSSKPSKLSMYELDMIRILHGTFSTRELAVIYDVSQSHIGTIVDYSWKPTMIRDV